MQKHARPLWQIGFERHRRGRYVCAIKMTEILFERVVGFVHGTHDIRATNVVRTGFVHLFRGHRQCSFHGKNFFLDGTRKASAVDVHGGRYLPVFILAFVSKRFWSYERDQGRTPRARQCSNYGAQAVQTEQMVGKHDRKLMCRQYKCHI